MTKRLNFRINFDVVNLLTHIIRKRILKFKVANILKKLKKLKSLLLRI